MRVRFALACAALAVVPATAGAQLMIPHERVASGPFEIALFPTRAAPDATGFARLVYAHSPFGVAVTTDGRARYDVQVSTARLPRPDSLGAYTAYVAWAASSDLSEWHRLGVVANGEVTVGTAALNKFLLVITAEADTLSATRAGPVVLRGTSPSSWLQSFLTHPLFRGVAP